jgi:hypothetical protein
MDNVNNRSLFRRKSQAARDKVRQMGMVREPQGILASFPELMMAANRQQPQPVRFQQGGDIALEAFRQGAPEPTLGEQIAANPAFAGVIPPQVDITATPTPRGRVEVPDISTLVRNNLGDNQEAQDKFTELETALTNPETTDEERKEAVTSAANAPNTREGLRSVASQITGRELPESATVDELNRAITGVALGGAIGGPRSVAERISNALLMGLEAQRETAISRERFGQELAVAQAKAQAEGTKGFLETPQGEAALDMYNEFLSQQFTPAQAYARMDEVSPGLGTTLRGAMSTTSATPAPAPSNAEQLLTQAREAVEQGRDRGVVEQMLRDMGVDPAGL